MRRSILYALAIVLCGSAILAARGAAAQCAVPNTLTNGQTTDATQVMANFNAVTSCINTAAPAGATNAVQTNAGGGSFGAVGPLTNGQLVIGSTGSAPAAATLTAGSGITITNGAGSVTIAASGGGGVGGIDIFYPPGGLSKPLASNFTLNTTVTGTTLTDMPSGRGTVLIQPASGSSTAESTQEQVLPGGSSFTATAFIFNTGLLTANWFVGLAIKDSTGKYDAYGVRNGPYFSRFEFASLGTCCDGGGNFTSSQGQPFFWLRVQLTGGNFIFSASYDGENWMVIGTEAANSYLGSSLSTAGLIVLNNSGPAFMIDCFSWSVTSP